MIASHPARERMFRFPPARRVLALTCLRGGGRRLLYFETVYKRDALRFFSIRIGDEDHLRGLLRGKADPAVSRFAIRFSL